MSDRAPATTAVPTRLPLSRWRGRKRFSVVGVAETHDLTALEQAAAVRARELSPVDIVEHYLDRVQRHDARLGAFVTVTPEVAVEQARAAERAVMEADGTGTWPSLYGVPVPIKDLAMVDGVPTTFGSAAYDDFVPPVDDGVAARVREAGGILLGKTNTPEFGLPCYTESAVAPPARTPWDPQRSAGGSSGGAAAAVAAGLAPVAHGSDGGGSIRIPASACGLVGLKPARGRVTNGPHLQDVTGLPVHGPLARTVGDAAALLDAMAGQAPGDPYWVPPLPEGRTFLSAADREPGRLRIGCYRQPVLTETEVHPDCVAAYESAVELLIETGHDVVEVAPPFGPDSVPSFETVWAVLAAANPVPPEREERLMPLTRWMRDRGSRIAAPDHAAALAAMQRLTREAVGATAAYDAVLTPTLAQPPAFVGALRDDADPARDFENQKAFTPFTAPYNVTGQPAISLPLHWNDEGLPIGVMLAGRPAEEMTLISLGAQLERARPWRERHPSLW